MLDSVFIQEYFRIRSGDSVGLNTDSGWAAAQNVNATIGTGIVFRIRVKVRETAGGDDANNNYKLQVKRNAGSFVDLDVLGGAAAPAVQAVLSSQYADGDAATELLTNTTTYVNGEGLEDNLSGNYSLTSEELELEFCLMIMSFHDGPTQNVATDTLEFRVVEGDGTVFGGTYTNPVVTVSETAGYIGGAYIEHPHDIGPFKDTNGALYFPIEYAETENSMAMLKSADGGDTWRPMDAANRPTQGDIEGLSIFQDGDTLHIAHAKSAIFYHRFRMSDHSTNPDTWEIIDESVDATITGHSTQSCSIVKRADGTIVMFYADAASPDRCRYKIRNGTWGSQLNLDSEATNNFVSPWCVLGESDTTHILYKDDTNGIMYHQTLNSSDTLGTRQSIVTSMDTSLVRDDIPYLRPLYYDDGGVEVIVTIYKKLSGSQPIYSTHIRDGTPQTEALVSSNNVEEDEGGNHMVIADAAVDVKEAWVFYGEDNVYDIWYDSNDDEGGWGTDVEEQDAVTAHWIRANVFTHSSGNGGDKVFGYVWDDGSDGGTGRIRYDELVLEVGGVGQPTQKRSQGIPTMSGSRDRPGKWN